MHLGGERYGTQGFWVQPTIITNTLPNTEFVKEEIFGPVAVIMKFKDEDDILNSENESSYGLTASFFTKDLTRGVKVANKVQAGTVWVNCMNSLYPNVPYGGIKQSGIGRECGQYALDTCVVTVALLYPQRDIFGKLTFGFCQLYKRQIRSNERWRERDVVMCHLKHTTRHAYQFYLLVM